MSTDIDNFAAGVPGMYADVPEAIYHALDACSASRLKALARSALHCRHAIDNPSDDSETLKRGSAAHACLLQPEVFAARYAVGPDVDLRTKAGKAEWESFTEANPGKVHLRGKTGESVANIHRAVWSHPAAARALSSAGHSELSLVWTDPATGLLCKARIDHIGGDVCWDIKTTVDASPEGFAFAIRKYRWDVQAAFYLHGLARCDLLCEGFGFVAVESAEPNAVGVYTLEDSDLGDAEEDMTGLMEKYAACLKAGKWGGYSDSLNVIKLPPKRRSALIEV